MPFRANRYPRYAPAGPPPIIAIFSTISNAIRYGLSQPPAYARVALMSNSRYDISRELLARRRPHVGIKYSSQPVLKRDCRARMVRGTIFTRDTAQPIAAPILWRQERTEEWPDHSDVRRLFSTVKNAGNGSPSPSTTAAERAWQEAKWRCTARLLHNPCTNRSRRPPSHENPVAHSRSLRNAAGGRRKYTAIQYLKGIVDANHPSHNLLTGTGGGLQSMQTSGLGGAKCLN